MEGCLRSREDLFVPEMQLTQGNQKGVGVTCRECEVYVFWSTPSFARPDISGKPSCRGCSKLREGMYGSK